jgi:class 3 adenylate cyclase/tetratricopeptide (TPR) repeat protein
VDIAAWLRELRLERYEQAFRENDIASDVLPELTDQDLKDLGVSLGHRRLLLRAIRALADDRASNSPPQSAYAPVMPPQPALRSEAERRQLTVLFCDLVGSTELAARLDPEDMGAVMGAYQRATAAVIERFEGHVARYLGDGVLAYFGWPQAHEDDAERAVRAGLELVDAVTRLEADAKTRLRARIGIATGQVVVGDLVGEGAARDEAVVGDTPNLAARLQGLAAPSGVVISQATRRLVGGLFELTDLGPVPLKGFAQPLTVWRVDGEGRAEGRFEALHGGRLTPLVGREHELAILLERWSWAKDGDGQVVLLSGEPGIGKSRVVQALRERLGDQPYTPLSQYCSPYHTNSALHPVIGLLERAARLDRDEPPEAQLAKLEVMLGQSSGRLDEVVPLLASLLGVPTATRYPALALTWEMQKRRTLQALVDQLAGLAAQQPVLALYEDVHWIDPSTLELLSLVIERIRRLPVLVLITFRPEFQPRWTGHAHVTTLTMNRLGRRQGADLVARVTGDKPLPVEVVEAIVARTDGVPLFVEELTKTVLESGLLADAGDRYELSGPLPSLGIPATLHDSLMARLDRLGSVKEVAQIGAVIGREFSHELFAAVSPLSEDKLGEALDHLVASELVFRRGSPPEATYSFKHALVQDAAYRSLLKGKRQQWHARIAKALEEQIRNAAESQPEVLAHHFSQADSAEPAVDYWLKAGELATRRSANAEALGHLRSAEAELLKLESAKGQRFDDRWVALHMARGPILIALSGWAAPEVEQAYRSAERAGARGRELFDVQRGLYNVYLLRGDLQSARRAAARLHKIATESRDQIATESGARDLLLGSHRALGLCDFLAGRFRRANTHLEKAIALYDLAQHRHHAFVQGVDPAVIAYAINAWAFWFLGDLDKAPQTSSRAMEAAQRAEHPFSIAYALCLASSLAQCRGKAAEAASRCDAALKLSMEHAFPYWRAWAGIVRGWASVELGDREGGLAMLKDGLERYSATGAAQMRSYGLCLLAGAYQRAGLWSESAKEAQAAIAEAEQTGVTFYLPEAYRLSGEALCHLHPTKTAGLRRLVRAVRVAEGQRSRPLLLRACLSILELSGQKRLRTTIFVRAKTTLRRMQQRASASELDVVEWELAEAGAESITLNRPPRGAPDPAFSSRTKFAAQDPENPTTR